MIQLNKIYNQAELEHLVFQLSSLGWVHTQVTPTLITVTSTRRWLTAVSVVPERWLVSVNPGVASALNLEIYTLDL